MTKYYESVFLSNSSSGRLINSTAIVSPGQTIHTVATGSSLICDEVYLYGVNNSTHDRLVTVEWGSTAVGNNITFPLPSSGGLYTIIPGLRAGLGMSVAAFSASSSSVGGVNFGGYINRISSAT